MRRCRDSPARANILHRIGERKEPQRLLPRKDGSARYGEHQRADG
jgi:hypothetical protein